MFQVQFFHLLQSPSQRINPFTTIPFALTLLGILSHQKSDSNHFSSFTLLLLVCVCPLITNVDQFFQLISQPLTFLPSSLLSWDSMTHYLVQWYLKAPSDWHFRIVWTGFPMTCMHTCWRMLTSIFLCAWLCSHMIFPLSLLISPHEVLYLIEISCLYLSPDLKSLVSRYHLIFLILARHCTYHILAAQWTLFEVPQVNCCIGHEPVTRVLVHIDELSFQKYLHFNKIPKGNELNLNH